MRDLRPLLSPRSAAVIGASPDNVLLDYVLRRGYPGRVVGVNPKYAEVRGAPCYPEIGAIPERVDLAIVSVPARAVPGVVEQCVVASVGGLVVISSGFAELGDEGAALEARLRATVRRAGIPMLGPNCLGFVNAGASLAATISQVGAQPFGRLAPVAFVTQSGAFGTAIAAMARIDGWTFRYFVNTGNEADVECAEVIDYLLDDPDVTLVAGYLEGLRDGPGFVRAARKALGLGKTIACVKVGRSRAGTRAAASHTASMTGADEAYATVFRQHGIVRADDETELLDLIALHCAGRVPGSRRVAIVTMSGGAGVLMSDQCEREGLEVPELAASTRESLRALLPPFGAAGNPVDLTAQFALAPMEFRKILGEILDDPGTDSIAIFLNLLHKAWTPVVDALGEASRTTVKPLAVAWVLPPDGAVAALRESAIPVFPSPGRLTRALARLVTVAERRRNGAGTDILAVEPSPDGRPRSATAEPRAAREGGALGAPHDECQRFAGSSGHADDILTRSAPWSTSPGAAPTRTVAEHEAKPRLRAAGIPVTREILTRSVEEATAAARSIGYPVVLKVQSPDLPHKTDAGGVALGLASDDAVRATYDALLARVRRACPRAAIDGVLVQAEVRDAVAELIVGVTRDLVFGPLILCGLGGTLTEVFCDVARRLLPITRRQAETMLAELACLPLLTGARGRPRGDLGAVADVLVAVSGWALSEGDRLLELDINPLMVLPEGRGAVVVDAMIVERGGRSR